MLILELARALEEHKISYAIVGGFAVALHGAVRGTVDVDLVIAFSKDSFLAAEKALAAIGLESRLPLRGQDVFEFREEYIKNRNLVAWSFYNPQKPSEIVDIIITHDRREMKTKRFIFQGQHLEVIALPDLIKMKRESGRPQDLEDVRALETIRKRTVR